MGLLHAVDMAFATGWGNPMAPDPRVRALDRHLLQRNEPAAAAVLVCFRLSVRI